MYKPEKQLRERDDYELGIILDIGSYNSKIGYNDVYKPDVVFPTILSKNKGINEYNPDYIIGNEAISKIKEINEPYYTHEYGMCKNVYSMENIWNYALYKEMRVCPVEWKLFFTEIPLIDSDYRDRLTSVVFESLNPCGMYFENQAVTSLIASGRTTGVVIEIGYQISHVVPIFEGCVMHNAVQRIKDIGGMNITDFLIKMMKGRGVETKEFESKHVFQVENANSMKEKVCYISNNYDEECVKAKTTGYNEKGFDLPDGKKINIRGCERFKAPEILFKPTLNYLEVPGIHEATFKCIQKCDNDIKKELWENIVFGGGGSLVNGIEKRMLNEMKSLVKKNDVDQKYINVITPENRMHSSFIGGSVLSSLSSFNEKWATKCDYDDVGCAIIGRWCPNN